MNEREGDGDEEEKQQKQKNYDTKYNLIINDMHNMFKFKYFYYFIIITIISVIVAHILILRDSFSPRPFLRRRRRRPHAFVYYYKLHKYYMVFDEVLKWLVGAEKCINTRVVFSFIVIPFRFG